jgi:hypothetical protein
MDAFLLAQADHWNGEALAGVSWLDASTIDRSRQRTRMAVDTRVRAMLNHLLALRHRASSRAHEHRPTPEVRALVVRLMAECDLVGEVVLTGPLGKWDQLLFARLLVETLAAALRDLTGPHVTALARRYEDPRYPPWVAPYLQTMTRVRQKAGGDCDAFTRLMRVAEEFDGVAAPFDVDEGSAPERTQRRAGLVCDIARSGRACGDPAAVAEARRIAGEWLAKARSTNDRGLIELLAPLAD